MSLDNFIAFIKMRILKYASSIIIYCILGACIYYLLSVSWLKWGDLIIDTYRELWIPAQINDGRALYKDIFYPFGFFAPYLLAALYKLSGVCIYSAIGCGIVTAVAMSLILYKLSRFFLDRIFSLLTAITFLFIASFGFYCYNNIFNFILPYTFGSTFCILFIASALYFFLKFIFDRKEKYLLFWSLSLSFAFFSRPEMPIPTLAVFIAISALLSIKCKNIGLIRILLWSVSPLILAVIGYSLLLSKNHAYAGFVDSIFGYIMGPAQNPLSINWMGFDNILLNINYTVRSFFLHLLVVLLLGLASALFSSPDTDDRKTFLKYVSGMALIFLSYLLAANYLSFHNQYRCLPLVLVSGGALSLANAMRQRENYNENLAIATIFLVSAANIPRIFLKTHFVNYGFYLLSISLVCYYVFFAKIYKDYLNRQIKGSPRLFALLLLVFFSVMITPHWKLSKNMYGMKTLRMDTDKGTVLYWNNDVGVNFWSAVNYLKEKTSRNDKVVVFPEGIGINFFADRDMPLRNYNFVPYEILNIGEDNIISDLKRFDVDYVIVLSRDTSEYGYRAFGIDYAQKLYSWIRENYKIVKQFGPIPYSSKEFGLVIFKKDRLM